LDEAITNAMLHGNGLDAGKKVRVCLFVDEARWGAIVEDEGDGFGPEDVSKPHEVETEFEEAGRGIHLMDSFLDALLYNPPGNRVMLVRGREPGAETAEVPSGVEAPGEPEEAVSTTVLGEVVTAQISYQRLSEENYEELHEALREASALARALVVDMRNVQYLSSRAIGLLVGVYKRQKEAGGVLVLAGLRPQVGEILSSVNLDRLFPFAEDAAEGVELARRELDSSA
jgi:anti-anti-sigma factor